MKKIIRIQAKCERFEVDEQLPEDVVIKRLQQLKYAFLHRNTSSVYLGRAKKKFYIGTSKLIVNTSVVNPNLL